MHANLAGDFCGVSDGSAEDVRRSLFGCTNRRSNILRFRKSQLKEQMVRSAFDKRRLVPTFARALHDGPETTPRKSSPFLVEFIFISFGS